MTLRDFLYQTDDQLDQHERFTAYLHATHRQIYYVRPPRYSANDAATDTVKAKTTSQVESEDAHGVDKGEEKAQKVGEESDGRQTVVAIRTKV